MEWYRAEITGDGAYIDAGACLPEQKKVIFEFQASSDEEAEKRANEFACSSEIRKEHWMTDPSPTVSVTKFVGAKKPTQEHSYLLS